MDSQETVGVSREMVEEIVWPAYERLGKNFGLLSYGCCEPLDPVWDLISQFPNLRKASVSPWTNEEKSGKATPQACSTARENGLPGIYTAFEESGSLIKFHSRLSADYSFRSRKG